MSEQDHLSRRDFLKGSLAAVTSLPWIDNKFLHIGLGRNREWNFANKELWSSRFWFPLSQETARKHSIPTLYDAGGPLDIYDRVQASFGNITHAREWEGDFASEVLRKHPDWATWVGHCHGLANAIALENEPFRSVRDIGLLTALHSADAYIRFTTQEAEIDQMLDFFIKTGRPMVANIPLGQSGTWFRVIDAVTMDKAFLRVTDFRFPFRSVSRDEIVSLYIPYHGSQEVAPEFQQLNLNWKNPFLEEGMVRRIVQRGSN